MSKPKEMQIIEDSHSSIAEFRRYKFIGYDDEDKIDRVVIVNFWYTYSDVRKGWMIKDSFGRSDEKVINTVKEIKL